MSKSDFDVEDFAYRMASEYGQRVAQNTFDGFMGCAYTAAGVSPIETMLGCALDVAMSEYGIGPEMSGISTTTGDKFEDIPLPPFDGIYGSFQVVIGQYRVDFLIAVRDLMYGTAFFAIECDGHDFHEKTKQQAERDKKRDRYLQSRGIAVFRYGGSEIWRDPLAAAVSILDDCFAALRSRSEGGK